MAMKIIWHGCEHEYQDKKFGKHMRMMNSTNKDGMWRCTVCGADVMTSKGLKKKDEKKEQS